MIREATHEGPGAVLAARDGLPLKLVPARATRVAAIVPSCSELPARAARIAGMERVDRLTRTLGRRGYDVIQAKAGSPEALAADLVVPDCHVLLPDGEVHLCTEGVRVAEGRLVSALRKPIDGIVSRNINRPISLFFTRRLMHTGIRPNHISIFTLLIGLSSGVSVAMGGYWYGLLGAFLLNAGSILDGVDGELARLRFQTSLLGQWLDTLSDDLGNVSFMVGLSIAAPWPWLRYFGLVGLGAFLVTQAIIYYVLVTVYHSGDLLVFRWESVQSKGLMAKLGLFVKRDFFCLAAVVVAACGILPVALPGLAIGALVVFMTLMRQLKRHGLPKRQGVPARVTGKRVTEEPIGSSARG